MDAWGYGPPVVTSHTLSRTRPSRRVFCYPGPRPTPVSEPAAPVCCFTLAPQVPLVTALSTGTRAAPFQKSCFPCQCVLFLTHWSCSRTSTLPPGRYPADLYLPVACPELSGRSGGGPPHRGGRMSCTTRAAKPVQTGCGTGRRKNQTQRQYQVCQPFFFLGKTMKQNDPRLPSNQPFNISGRPCQSKKMTRWNPDSPSYWRKPQKTRHQKD